MRPKDYEGIGVCIRGYHQDITKNIEREMRFRSLKAVSYTHLDVYKRQILYRIKGKGCFVRELADQKRSRIYSFTEAVRNEGKLPGKKQLSLEKKEADAYLADKLQMEEGEEIFEIRSLYYADGCLLYTSGICWLFKDSSRVHRTFKSSKPGDRF